MTLFPEGVLLRVQFLKGGPMRLLSFVLLLSASGLCVPAFSLTELNSSRLRGYICDEINHEIKYQDEYFYYGDLDKKSCLKGSFLITDAVFDKTLNKTTLMKVSFQTEAKPFKLEGSIDIFLSIEIGKDGKSKQKWLVRNLDLEAIDQRPSAEVIEGMIQQDQIDVGNGDFGAKKVSAIPSEKDILADLEKALEDHGDSSDSEYSFCRYTNDTTAEYVIRSLKEHSEILALFVEKQKKAGKLVRSVMRGYDDGASEYCSHYYFEFYLEDGTHIWINIDQTT